VRDIADRIQEAWQRERPDLDVSSIGVLTRVVRIARHLDRARARELREIGTDAATLDVLATLRRAGGPYTLTAGELQRTALVTSGAVSQRLDKLERAGFVRRISDVRDGRLVQVELTKKGLREVDRIVEELMLREAQLLEPLTSREQEQLEKLLRRWLLSFEPDEDAVG
jgi:DNA-binding MarR family transcriptional regulator